MEMPLLVFQIFYQSEERSRNDVRTRSRGLSFLDLQLDH
jgi:hypothetical protein